MKKLLWLLILTIISFSYTMEHMPRNKIIQLRQYPPIYIGKSNERNQLEQQYNKQFPANTIFFPVTYYDLIFNGQSFIPSSECPDYIDYDSIKNCKESQQIELTINAVRQRVTCKQIIHYHRHRDPRKNFETIAREQLYVFINKPNCFINGMEDLLQKNIVLGLNNIKHGENANPDVLRTLESRTEN